MGLTNATSGLSATSVNPDSQIANVTSGKLPSSPDPDNPDLSDKGFAGFLKGIGNFFSGKDAYNRQLDLMKHQEKYNTHMSNTAVTRYMNQLKKNGLNPALAVNSGFAGSSPTISAPSNTSGLSANQSLSSLVSLMLPFLIAML